MKLACFAGSIEPATVEVTSKRAPYVKGVKVEGKVVSHGKGKKILVYKYKAKKNYRRTQGHRQPYTKVEITKIKMPTEKAEVKEASAKKATAKKEA